MRKIVEKIKEILFNENKAIDYDIFALQKLYNLSKIYIPWTSSSLRPSAVVKILNDIVINKRRKIIEFGSGISTLYIAYILKNNGGHIYTVDHDINWIKIVKKLLEENDILENIVTFVHSPLKKSSLSLNNLNWYNKEILDASLPVNDKFDLVIIDGPPAYTKKIWLSRYPAIPFLMKRNKIAKNSTIILDDINRKGEQNIVRKWENEYGFKFINLYKDCGIAIAQNGDSYNI